MRHLLLFEAFDIITHLKGRGVDPNQTRVDLIRKSIEDRIHADIRNGKDLVKKDLDAIFALSVTIITLEELLK